MGLPIKVNVSGLESVRRQLIQIGSAGAQMALDQTAEDVEDYVRQEAAKHNRTGALVASIDKQRIPGGWEVFHDLQRAPEALFVHWGTKPHVIKPKGRAAGGKNALRWSAGGAFKFAGKVNHPGYKGDPWMVRAAAKAPLIFQKHVEDYLARINRG